MKLHSWSRILGADEDHRYEPWNIDEGAMGIFVYKRLSVCDTVLYVDRITDRVNGGSKRENP